MGFNSLNGWHKEDIKAAIRKSGVTLIELSRLYGLSDAAISKALNEPSPQAEIAIAKHLDIPLHELWPTRWTSKGKRIRPRYAYLYLDENGVEI